MAAGGPGAVTHVFVNRGWVPFERVVKGFRYLHEGSIEPTGGSLPQVIADDFEDPWNRGRHDAPKVVATLGRVMQDRGVNPGNPPIVNAADSA
jgi:hypothetical protein